MAFPTKKYCIPFKDEEEYDRVEGADTKIGPMDSVSSFTALLSETLDAFPFFYGPDGNHSEAMVALSVTHDEVHFFRIVDMSGPLPVGYRSCPEQKPRTGFLLVRSSCTEHPWQWNALPNNFREPGVPMLIATNVSLDKVVEYLLLEARNMIRSITSRSAEHMVELDAVSAIFVGLVSRYTEAVLDQLKLPSSKRKARPDSPRIIYARDGSGIHAVGGFCVAYGCGHDWVPEKWEYEQDPLEGVCSFSAPHSGVIPDGFPLSGKPLETKNQVAALLLRGLLEYERTHKQPGQFSDAEQRVIVWFKTDDPEETKSVVVLHMGGMRTWADHRDGLDEWPTPDVHGSDETDPLFKWTPWADPKVQYRYLVCGLDGEFCTFDDDEMDPETAPGALPEMAAWLCNYFGQGPQGILAILVDDKHILYTQDAKLFAKK